MCLECGYYNGRQVMDLEAKKKAREERIEKKRELVRSQYESIAPGAGADPEAVAENEPEETKESKEKQ